MKTFGNLWSQVVSWENLLTAYQKCRRRKRAKPEAAAFDFHWESHLLGLQRELTAGTYEPGKYRHFYIHEPKLRKISAAPFRDRVVHHAVVQVLEPIFERRFIHDSYACRLGKGTHRALDRAQRFLRRYAYYLKTDIVRFYPSADHEAILAVLGRYVNDKPLLDLIAKIVASGDGVFGDEPVADDQAASVRRAHGLPIGNLTSQFFANVLLDQIDHFVKEELRSPGYVRYADDMVLFADDKPALWDWRDAMSERLAAMRLRLHQDKTYVRPTTAGLKFLGFVLRRDGRRLQQGGLRRFNQRLRRLRWLKAQRLIRPKDIARSLQAWLGHVRSANSTGIRRAIWKRARF
jgi:retron-type reverse transcriptase